jgi:hypothetical protein
MKNKNSIYLPYCMAPIFGCGFILVLLADLTKILSDLI